MCLCQDINVCTHSNKDISFYNFNIWVIIWSDSKKLNYFGTCIVGCIWVYVVCYMLYVVGIRVSKRTFVFVFTAIKVPCQLYSGQFMKVD